MRALVTGAAGFVGSTIVRELIENGARVSCLVRKTSDLRNLIGLDVDLVEGDLTDRSSLERAMEGCVQLYHVAAFYSTNPNEAGRMVQANIEGTRNVLAAAAEHTWEHIVHTSTIGTIGRPSDNRLPTEEDTFDDWTHASPYARSKIEAEKIALDYARQGLPVVVVNPCAPVGAGDYKPSSTGERIIAYLHRRTPSYLAGGINFISVKDVARGHLLAAQRGRPGERYILGHAAGNLNLDDFYRLMEQVSRVKRPQGATPSLLEHVRQGLHRLAGTTKDVRPAEPATDYRPAALTANPERAIRELGLPQTPLESAFRQAVDWFRANNYV